LEKDRRGLRWLREQFAKRTDQARATAAAGPTTQPAVPTVDTVPEADGAKPPNGLPPYPSPRRRPGANGGTYPEPP
jgi:hypothetical protein